MKKGDKVVFTENLQFCVRDRTCLLDNFPVYVVEGLRKLSAVEIPPEWRNDPYLNKGTIVCDLRGRPEKPAFTVPVSQITEIGAARAFVAKARLCWQAARGAAPAI